MGDRTIHSLQELEILLMLLLMRLQYHMMSIGIINVSAVVEILRDVLSGVVPITQHAARRPHRSRSCQCGGHKTSLQESFSLAEILRDVLSGVVLVTQDTARRPRRSVLVSPNGKLSVMEAT